MLETEHVDKTIRRHTDFDEMKADEYRYWQSRPVHERLDTAAELSEGNRSSVQQVRRCRHRNCRRTMKITSLIFIFILTLSSCRQTGNAPAPAAESSVQPSQPSEADNWQRTKDCAARVDAMREEKSSESLKQGRVAHYSRKYGRCFVKITMTMTRPIPNNRPDSVMLMDAFEGSIGAMVPFVPPCYLGGKQEDCAKAEAFIDDAMAN
jgi:hypothetical protein